VPDTGIVRVPGIIENIEKVYGKKTWGAVGFCWGGKVVSVISGPDSLFKVACQAHPGLIDPADAAKVYPVPFYVWINIYNILSL